jgi:ribulose-phosphate 3-epimerase
MIVNPDQYLKSFADAGAAVISVHYEACTHLHRSLQAIKALNVKAGVAINPHTNITLLADVIKDLDLVCMMSVNPGFGGQKFIEQTYAKIEALKNLIIQNNASTLIEIDGGVDFNNARKLVDCGADVLVAGNTVFGNANPTEAISQLKAITA